MKMLDLHILTLNLNFEALHSEKHYNRHFCVFLNILSTKSVWNNAQSSITFHFRYNKLIVLETGYNPLKTGSPITIFVPFSLYFNETCIDEVEDRIQETFMYTLSAMGNRSYLNFDIFCRKVHNLFAIFLIFNNNVSHLRLIHRQHICILLSRRFTFYWLTRE